MIIGTNCSSSGRAIFRRFFEIHGPKEWRKLQNVAFWALVFEQKATDASFCRFLVNATELSNSIESGRSSMMIEQILKL